MMHQTALGTSSLKCLLERVDDEIGTEVVLERPADNATAKAVHDYCEIQPALPGAQVGDVGDPKSVRGRGPEVALDEIVGDTHARNANGRAATAPFTVPLMPACRISRSTRLRPTATPSARRSR